MIELENISKRSVLSENLFYAAYSFFLIRGTLGNTTFVQFFSIYGMYLNITLALAVGIFVLKLFVDNTFSIKSVCVCAFLTAISFFCYKETHYTDILILLLLFIFSKNVSFKKLVKIHFSIYLTITVFAIICSISGIIENYTIVSRGVMRFSLGNTYPTDFSAGIFYLILDYLYLRDKRWKFTDTIIVTIIMLVIYVYTKALTSTLLSISIVFLASMLNNNYSEKIEKLVKNIGSVSFGVCAFLSLYIQRSAAELNGDFLKKLNSLLENRIYYGSIAIEKYGLPIFGNRVSFFGGGWRTNQLEKYFYIDNGYLQVTLLYGLIVLILFIVGYFYICKTARSSERMLPLIIIFISLSTFIEPRFFNIIYDVFIFRISTGLYMNEKVRFKQIS